MGGRSPCHSINFITAHDGFSLADLVSYNEKHNEANGEDNRCASSGTGISETDAGDPQLIQHVVFLIPIALGGGPERQDCIGLNGSRSTASELSLP